MPQTWEEAMWVSLAELRNKIRKVKHLSARDKAILLVDISKAEMAWLEAVTESILHKGFEK